VIRLVLQLAMSETRNLARAANIACLLFVGLGGMLPGPEPQVEEKLMTLKQPTGL
jgi:hypothetical protein